VASHTTGKSRLAHADERNEGRYRLCMTGGNPPFRPRVGSHVDKPTSESQMANG
jgi:hypothetical protein